MVLQMISRPNASPEGRERAFKEHEKHFVARPCKRLKEPEIAGQISVENAELMGMCYLVRKAVIESSKARPQTPRLNGMDEIW